MAIIKKTIIDNTIFKELQEKYPPLESENGVTYKQKLDYLTFEIDFLSNPTIRMLRKKHGSVVIAVIFYLRTEMCKNGWKVRVDDGIYYQTLLQDCSYCCDLDMGVTSEIIHDLVNNHEMYVVCDDSVEEGKFLTCPQQIYNYEMACQKRKTSRERQARLRAKRNESSEQKKVSDIVEDLQSIEKASSNPDAERSDQQSREDSFNKNIEENNPFGIGQEPEWLFQ